MVNPIKCECGRTFEPRLKTSKLQGGVEKTFFKCPHCGARTTAYYTDPEIRKLQTRQRVLRNDRTLRLSEDPIENRDLILREFEQNKRSIKEKMDALRRKYD